MTKTISTLVEDIQQVIINGGGWGKVQESFTKDLNKVLEGRLGPPQERKPSLRMSNLGTPCTRKLWYYVNEKGNPVGQDDPSMKFKFLFGDILEALLIHLAMAAGHKVEGQQDEIDCFGIKGHRDCVIDGVTIDVKSASTYSYRKFATNSLRKDDPFGYIRQLTGYVLGSRADPLVTDKTRGGFLVVDKTLGNICLDMYDLSKEMADMESYINLRRLALSMPKEPPRGFDEVPEGKSGNMKVDVACSYCAYVKDCYPGVRTFLYAGANGASRPVMLSKVVKEPLVKEAK